MVFSKFASLSVRPPTPPKDLNATTNGTADADDADETLHFLDDPFGEKPVLPPRVAAAKAALSTPEQSPSSDIDIDIDIDTSLPSSATSTRRKRVNFELQSCAASHTKAFNPTWTPTRGSPLRPLPPTRLTHHPLKSILKPSDATPTPPPADAGAAAHSFKTFAEMLESIVKLLASAERPSRLDAYHALQRTMQAYDKVPDDQALRQKMTLLTQFIRRDVQAPSPTGTGLDSQLVSQALKLLMALFRITDLTAAMDDDFCSFIVDRIIAVASDSAMPKSVVNTHLAVCMQQNFRPKTMTVARVEKLLDALDTIHERVTGFSVQAYRIRIFRKLVQQRPDVMIKHTECWFKRTVKALVAGQKDINQSALDTCLAAAKSIGHDPLVAKSVLTVLNRTRSDGETLAHVMIQELDRMLTGDNAALVPQIWSAVTGLLRNSLQGPLFFAMKEWLKLFESFFKSDKDLVKVHANVAFCFLLYAVGLAPDTASGWTSMFLDVPSHQLQRRVPGKKAERDASTSGYVALLYHAFPPTASFDQLDRYWTEFIANFWTPLVHSSSPQHPVAACRVVTALLNGSRKPWNEHRALDLRPQCMIQRAELPLLDPRWVRKSLSLILKFVETLLEATPWSENDQQADEPVKTMWLAVLDALVEASSKEVMASSETKDAMAHIVNLIRRVWDTHTAKLAVPQEKEDQWAKKFCFLIETVVQKLGASQFADKSLTRNNENDLEVASTPTHRARQQGARTSPLLYFADLLISQSEGKLSDSVRGRALKLTLEPCFKAQNTRVGRLELLRDYASVVASLPKAAVAITVWVQLTDLLQASIDETASEVNERGSRPFGKEYEVIVELIGLCATFDMDTSQVDGMLSSFIRTVRSEAGEGAVVLAVIEPVSQHILRRTSDENKTNCLPYITMLLKNLPRQMSRRILEQGRQLLWPSSPAAGRTTDFDPYLHLYAAIVSIGSAAYQNLNQDRAPSTKAFLAALSASIQHCSTSHLAVYLRKTQKVMAIWVEDPEKKMQSKELPLKALHREVINLWQEVNKAIERLPRKDSQILLHLEALITSGFLSRRRGIVNISIKTWNNTFGKEDSLRYPTGLECALRQLCGFVELELPSLDLGKEDQDLQLSFYDSDTSTKQIKSTLKSPRVKGSPFRISKSARKSAPKSPAAPTPGSSRRVSMQNTPKVRLRHDNSQIQFEPIVSSPSNPFNQQSQILTDRQKEMVDRQRLTTGLFANMGATSPLFEAVPSPMEIHSDAPSAVDYISHASRTTPSKALAAMGPMDMFLGSSPTPHARRRAQQVDSDATSVATPTTVRNFMLAPNDELGSSPPRFEVIPSSVDGHINAGFRVGSSFDWRQPESLQSFDEGTTLDEEALLAAEVQAERPGNVHIPDDTIMSEVPSSAIDVQLTAQIDAELQALEPGPKVSTDKVVAESINDFVDAASHQPSRQATIVDNDNTEFDGSQLDTLPKDNADLDTSSISRVGDSFDESPAKSSQTPRTLRRSSRHSATSSPVEPTSVIKPKQTPGRKARKSAVKEAKSPVPPIVQQSTPTNVDDDMLDNIIVASPTNQKQKFAPPSKKRDKGRKRKSMSGPEIPARVVVPDTSRKTGIFRRSQSLLSQVENSQDILVEDTPAPKRARGRRSHDVSEAKRTPSPSKTTTTLELESSQTKRLSHVQVTPKRSSEYGSSFHETPMLSVAAGPPVDHVNDPLVAEAPPTPTPVPVPAPEPASKQPTAPLETSTTTTTPSRSFAERVILTPRSIINQLKHLKDYLFSAPQLVLGRDEEREIDDALFDIRRQVLIAGLRGEESGGGGGVV